MAVAGKEAECIFACRGRESGGGRESLDWVQGKQKEQSDTTTRSIRELEGCCW